MGGKFNWNWRISKRKILFSSIITQINQITKVVEIMNGPTIRKIDFLRSKM